VRHDDRRLNLPVLQHLLNTHDPREGRGRDRQLKFVVGHPDTTLNADLAEIEFLVSRLTGWLPEDILLMPEGINSPDQAHKAAVAAACLVRAWRYCTRLHIELYGHTRGT
jgi:7-carboxy-7-deazaguanine synthase